MIQISTELEFLAIISIIVIPLLAYFVKLEIRIRKLEELEHLMNLESKIEQLQTLKEHPLFVALSQLNLQDAMNLYISGRQMKNESNEE